MAGTVYYKMDDGTKIPLNPIPQASSVVTTTTNFGGILSGTDSTVQLALDTIDDHNHDSIYLNVANTTAYTPTANYHPATKKYVDDEISGIDLTAYLKKDGTVALTANWDAGSFKITAETFESDVVTGTAPLVVASTTLVSNLNSDLLDGQEGSYYLDLTNATNPDNLDHNSLNNLATGDVHTQYFLANCTRYIPNNTYILARNFADDGNVNMWKINASDQLEAGADIKLGTHSLGDGTGTLVFSGAGDLALNGGSFDIDDGEYYQIGGTDMFTADTDYQIKLGYRAGENAGGSAGGTVEDNIFLGGGEEFGKTCAGAVYDNVTVGGNSLTAFRMGYTASLVQGNLVVGPNSGTQCGWQCTGEVRFNALINSGYNMAISASNVYQNYGFGGFYAAGQNATGQFSNNVACGPSAGAYLGQNLSAGKNILGNQIFGFCAAYKLGQAATDHIYYNSISGYESCYELGKNSTSGRIQNIVTHGYRSGYQWGIADAAAIENLVLIGPYAGYAGTGSNYYILTCFQGTNFADNLAKSLTYGRFNSTTASQEFYIHATTQIGVGGSNYTQIDDDGYQTMAGTARVTKKVWIDASGLQAPGTKPAAIVEQGIGLAWEFTDGTDDTIECRMVLPSDMDRTVAPDVLLGWSTPTANAGNCRWQVEYLYRAPGEDMTAAADDTVVDNYACDDADDGLVITSVDVAAPGATDACLTLRIKRRADEAGDTLGEDNHLYGVCMQYTANCLGTQVT